MPTCWLFCVTLMRFYIGNSSAEEGACVGLKPDLQEGTGFNLLRVQFWTPLQRKRVSKRGQKVDPLKSKVVPPGGSSFGPFFGTFIVANLLKRLFQVEADLISSSCGWNLELWEAHFCAPAFSYVLRTKTGTFFVTLFSPISIALRPSRPASRPASKLARSVLF